MKCMNLLAWCFDQWRGEHGERRSECFASDTESSGRRTLIGTRMQVSVNHKREVSLTSLSVDKKELKRVFSLQMIMTKKVSACVNQDNRD